ncbi:MAG: PAS domain S-box protein [Theionarchaea archaeon]|nr:PAS domain S-box protein [Theionarchaea archaeon]
MIGEYVPFARHLMAAAVFSLVLGLYILIYYRTSRGIVGALLMFTSTEWMVGHALELQSTNVTTMAFWDKMQLPAILALPTIWFIYILYHTNHEKWLNYRILALLSIMPLITLVLAITNESHHLIWKSFTLNMDGPFLFLNETNGIWFEIYTVYAFALVICGILPLIHTFQSYPLYRWQTGGLLIGIAITAFSSVMSVTDLNPFPYVDLIPFALTVTNLTVAVSLFRFRLGDLVPMARETIIESMSDSIIVLDSENRIVDLNPSAHFLIGGSSLQVVGKQVDGVWPEWSSTIEPVSSEKGKEVVLNSNGVKRIYDVEISPLIDWQDITIGKVVVLRDITDRKRGEQVKASLREKEVLLKEIHHRVKNNLQIIISLLSLQSQYVKDKKYEEMLKESQNRIRTMALIHEKLYQSENLANIDFHEYMRTLVQDMAQSYGAQKKEISLTLDLEDISLGIDAAIPCGLILNELVSNSLIHAFPEGKGDIKIFLHSYGDYIELKVSDNGIGLPEGLDFRTTTSLGLHLVTILAEDQLDGEASLDREGGTTFQVRFKKKST